MNWNPLMQQRDFCKAMDIPVETKPRFRSDGLIGLGQELIKEEFNEVMREYESILTIATKAGLDEDIREATAHVHMQRLTGELADLIYVICQAANISGSIQGYPQG